MAMEVRFRTSPRFARRITAWCEDFAAMQDAGWAEAYPDEARILRTLHTAIRRALARNRLEKPSKSGQSPFPGETPAPTNRPPLSPNTSKEPTTKNTNKDARTA